MAERVSSLLGASTVGPSRESRVRLGAKALVRTPGRVLLVKERHSDGSAFWTLPGGGVHPEESLDAGLERELAEELRCRVAIDEPLTSFQYAHRSRPGTVSNYTVFDCRLLDDPAPNRDEGILEYRWVDPEVPPDSTLPQVAHLLERAGSL